MRKSKIFSSINYRKNLLIIMSCIAVVSILFSIIIIVSSYKRNNELIEEAEQQNIDRLNYSFESGIKQIITVSTNFAMADLQFMSAEDELYLDKKLTALQSQMHMCQSMFNYVEGIYIYNGTKVIYSGNKNINKDSFENNDNFNVIYQNGYLKIWQNRKVNDELYIVLDALQYKYISNSVIITINTYEFGKSILDEYDKDHMEFFIDNNNIVKISNRMEYVGKSVQDIQKTGASNNLTKDHYINHNNNNISYTSHNENMGLRCFIISGKVNYVHNSQILLQSIALCCISLIISLLIGYIISRYTYRPIKEIINTLDDFYPMVSSSNVDELKLIRESILKLKQNSSDVKNTIGALKQQQILSLQSQLSPHFIFNTLDALNWIALKEMSDKNDISYCIQKMANILKSAMDISTYFSKIESEIKISESCIEVLKIRYGIELDVKIQIDNELKQYKILKNCLQPLVENSIEHGLSDLEGNKQIKIKVYRNENDIIICVEDNGTGMSEEKLNLLRQSISNFCTYDSSHIGLRNVNNRLHLLYGEQYGITIESELNKGTCCKFSVPFQTQ